MDILKELFTNEEEEKICGLEEFLKIVSDSSIWENSKRIDQVHYWDGEHSVNVRFTPEVDNFLKSYRDDIIKMAMEDNVVVCHGFDLDTELTPEEEFERSVLPQSLWSLKEKYNCCIEFLYLLVYDTCKDIDEIGGIHLRCEDDSFEDPYYIWCGNKDIAVRQMYVSNVAIMLDFLPGQDVEERLYLINYFKTYVYNVFDDKLSNEWFKYTFNIDLIKKYYMAEHYFHLYDNNSFDEKAESMKNGILKMKMIGHVEGDEALTSYYDVINLVVGDIKDYLSEGKEIVLTKEVYKSGDGDIKSHYLFEGNHWLKLLVDCCDLEDSTILYKAFMDYVVLDRNYEVRESIEKDRGGKDVKKFTYYKVAKV